MMGESQMSKAITAMTNAGIELSMSDGDMIDSDPEEFQMEMMSEKTEESEDDLERDKAPSKGGLSDDSDIPSENDMQMEFESASDSDDDIDRVMEEDLAQSDVPISNQSGSEIEMNS